MASILGSVSIDDAVEAIGDVTASVVMQLDVARAKFGGHEITIEVSVPPNELVEECSDAVLKTELRDGGLAGDVQPIVEAIGYIRAGDLKLAAAMFGRVFEDSDLAEIESALR